MTLKVTSLDFDVICHPIELKNITQNDIQHQQNL